MTIEGATEVERAATCGIPGENEPALATSWALNTTCDAGRVPIGGIGYPS